MVVNSDNKMSSFFSRVYLWMFIGMVISGGTAYYTSVSTSMLKFVYNFFYIIMLAEILVVIGFSALRRRVSPQTAKLLFVIYSALSGLTLSSIFLVYKLNSVVTIFLVAAILFGIMALYGYYTKQDLTSFGKILMCALVAIIVLSIINIFVNIPSFSITIAIVGAALFLGITAWDMQKLKNVYYSYSNDEELLEKASIYGALDLYLDFVNIFLDLLRLFGRKRN